MVFRTFLVLSLLTVGCVHATSREATSSRPAASGVIERDPHSFSRPDEISVGHLDLDLRVDFEQQRLEGRASFSLQRHRPAAELVLDTFGLEIRRVSAGTQERTVEFVLGPPDPVLGSALRIPLEPGETVVHVEYATSAKSKGLQWLAPGQTSGPHPFLLTQSQSIHARSWVPCQDSPAARMTYEARVQVPKALLALMSAENPTKKSEDGRYTFRMPQAIPAYLLALAVGDLSFRPLDDRSGIYAEPKVIDAAAWEFEETPKLVAAAEGLYGPYRWGRYDLLILPRSFPYGGMENPRLSFISPSIIAGDRSLVALIAHELVHSWAGNLVTNRGWSDFWMNEGVNTYLTIRTLEAAYGRDYSETIAVLARGDAEAAIQRLGSDHPKTKLVVDLRGGDPDNFENDIIYRKGYLFLRLLEETVGRQRWDPFLAKYFQDFAFRSVDTRAFIAYLKEELGAASVQGIDFHAWLYGTGLPPTAPQPRSALLATVDSAQRAFLSGGPAASLSANDWTTHQWLRFLRTLPKTLPRPRMTELDQAYRLTERQNSEIAVAWLQLSIHTGYEPAALALERFLTTAGRRRFLEPLYRTLLSVPGGKTRALEIYRRARPGYHPIAQRALDAVLAAEP